MATASLNVIRPWLNLANPAASSPGNTAAAAAASAAPDAPAHAASPAAYSASASTASCHRASAAAATTPDAAAAPAAATATRGQHKVVLERFVGFSVENVESCQADVGDFFLAEDDFVARSLVLRRHDRRGAQSERCCGCTAQRQRGARGAHQRQCRLLTRSLGSLLCFRHGGGLPGCDGTLPGPLTTSTEQTISSRITFFS